jgi:hypothetical protein
MNIRKVKRRTVEAMRSTVRVSVRIPFGMTRSQAIYALRKLMRNGFRPSFGAE